MRKIAIAIAMTFLFGCSHGLRVIDFKSGETLNGGYSELTKETWVVMPDGTKLTGKYIVFTGNQMGMNFGTGTSFGSTSFGGINLASTSMGIGAVIGSTGMAYALLANPDTKLMLEILVNVSVNKGFGEARDNTGKTYRVVF